MNEGAGRGKGEGGREGDMLACSVMKGVLGVREYACKKRRAFVLVRRAICACVVRACVRRASFACWYCSVQYCIVLCAIVSWPLLLLQLLI